MFLQRKSEAESATAPNPGARVVTLDGEELGKVAEVEGSYFKVDAPMRRDYWLGSDFIVQSSQENVSLSFAKVDLDAHKLNEPGLEATEDPMRDIARDSVILSDSELLEQRARMERELAEQRKELPIHQSGGDDGTVGEPVEVELERLEDELGETASSVSSSTGAVVPRQSITPEDPDQARMRAAESRAATGQPAGDANGRREVTGAEKLSDVAASNGTSRPDIAPGTPMQNPNMTSKPESVPPMPRDAMSVDMQDAQRDAVWDPSPGMYDDAQGGSVLRFVPIAAGIAGVVVAIMLLRRRRSRREAVKAGIRGLPDKLSEVRNAAVPAALRSLPEKLVEVGGATLSAGRDARDKLSDMRDASVAGMRDLPETLAKDHGDAVPEGLRDLPAKLAGARNAVRELTPLAP